MNLFIYFTLLSGCGNIFKPSCLYILVIMIGGNKMTNLIYRRGTLIDLAKEIDLSTIRHSREIQKERINESLESAAFITGDFLLYTIEKNQVILYLANREHNLIFKNLNDAVKQLKEKNNYFPKYSDISSVIKAKSTLRINLNELKLKEQHDDEGDSTGHSYFEIYTASKTQDTKNNYDKLNKTQRMFAERVHGEGNDFENCMNMLNKNNQKYFGENNSRIGICVLDPEYVKQTLKDKTVKCLARLSELNNFNDYSTFFAISSCVETYDAYLWGVPLDRTDTKEW